MAVDVLVTQDIVAFTGDAAAFINVFGPSTSIVGSLPETVFNP
jgi:hypothetical protein